jgi:hypothetical protein
MPGVSIDLPVDKINLFVENPRFEPVKSQREALFAIIENQGIKLLELAKDIKDNGLNPGDLPYIIQDPSDPKFYIVLEGNRRFACLKILETPAIIKDYHDSKFVKNFKTLSDEYLNSKNRVLQVTCILYDSFLEAAPWIERKHIGEGGGKGTIPWISLQSNRFKRLLTGKASVELQVADFVKSRFPEIGKNIDRLPITNLERLLKDKYVRSQLGLEVKDSIVYSNIPVAEISKPLGKIINDLIDGAISVNDIYHSSDRKKYIDNLESDYKPNLSKILKAPVKLDPISAASPNTNSKKGKQSKSPLDRVTVIGASDPLKSNDTKIDQIIFELKHLNADKLPIGASFLLRALLEFTVQNYIERNSLIPSADKLHVKVTTVVNDLKSKKLVTKDHIKGIESWVSDPASWCSINSLNAVVHNKYFVIPIKTLISGFENIKSFLSVVWIN